VEGENRLDLPTQVNILGKVYKIEYVDKPSDVDIHKRESLWGQCDYWTRSIRVFRNDDSNIEDLFHIVLHEILHGIISDLHLKTISSAPDHEDIVDLLALALADVLQRNDWLKK
jgi:hypothetical protein